MHKSLKNSDESVMFNNWWKFRQEYYEPETEDEFEALVVASENFISLYKGTNLERLARKMVLLHEEDAEIRLNERGKIIVPKEEQIVSENQIIEAHKTIPIPAPMQNRRNE